MGNILTWLVYAALIFFGAQLLYTWLIKLLPDSFSNGLIRGISYIVMIPVVVALGTTIKNNVISPLMTIFAA